MPNLTTPLTIAQIHAAYRSGELSPSLWIERVLEQIREEADPGIWITLTPEATLQSRATALDAALRNDPAQALMQYPLLGIPFGVKDNIDVAGLPTTAACPAFAYFPQISADVVARLEDAGAIVIGKTNLDQFATGLVGTRSPYGAVKNPFNPAYISGGSSSGSAAATALGQVVFSLGTDTAGSGRVPAGFCNLVGIKPTPGLVSNRGVVPACRSLDCVSVFAHTVTDGWRVLSVIASGDDPYILPAPPLGTLPRGRVIGVPEGLQTWLDPLAWKAFSAALSIISQQPGTRIETVDLSPFHRIAALLYDGPWVAERRAALGGFFDEQREEMDPTVAAIIAKADTQSATDAFAAHYRLRELTPQCLGVFEHIDALLVPTTPTIYTQAEIAGNPIELNSRLGRYTNFVNLLGMAALALPGPFREDGLPAGVTLIAPGGADHRLAEMARSWEPALHLRLGVSQDTPPRGNTPLEPLPYFEETVQIAVVGAHLSGLPLNWQLLERGARLLETTQTAPEYRLYALPGTVPPKPGLIRVPAEGHAIAVEVWEMPLRNFGSFVAEVPPPLGIGTLTLADGRTVKSFICEGIAATHALDISAHGGWRNFLSA